MENMTWNGLWTNNVRYNFKVINILLAIEICLAFSPFGFIQVDPISITTLHIVVIIAALWGGPVGGGLVGTMFGLCSMWKSEVSASYVGDLMFAPTRSGNPIGSIMVSITSRAAFGVIVGLIFLLLFMFIKSNKKRMIIGLILAILGERIHPTLVKMNLNIFFDKNYEWYSSFIEGVDLETIVQLVLLCAAFLWSYWFFNTYAKSKIYNDFLEIQSKIKTKKRVMILFVAIFLGLIILLIVHMIQRMQMIWKIKGLTFDADGRYRVFHLMFQFIITVSCLSALFIEYFKYVRSMRQLNVLKEEKNRADLELAYERKANESKTVFLSTMSHDIRTPMNAIVGLTDLAIKNIDNKTKVLEYLDRMQYSSENLISLLNDILDISKIESGNINLTNREFNLYNRVNNLIVSMTPMMEEKRIKFKSNINIKQDLFIKSDELRISQIGLNLFSNAIKYTKDEITLNVYILDITNDNKNVMIYFEIIDNGRGMSEEFMKHMFEPFAREQDGRIDSVGGTGLGLAIVKRIIDAMNGKIVVESKVDKGSKFVVYVPVLKSEENKKLDLTNQYKEEFIFKDKNIIVCDDIEINYLIVSESLNEIGVNTFRASNGKECIDLLNSKEEGYFDLILMDLQMPIMNGYEATRIIRSLETKNKDIPIIAMTADAFAEDVEKCLQSGMNNHISKPISIVKLKKIIEEELS